MHGVIHVQFVSIQVMEQESLYFEKNWNNLFISAKCLTTFLLNFLSPPEPIQAPSAK